MSSLFAFLLLAAAWPTLRWQPWVSGLEAPVDLKSPKDGTGRLFVLEQRGRVRLIKDGVLAATPVLDIVSKVQYRDEMGLLGIAFPPGPAGRPAEQFYVNYVDRQRRTIVSRFRLIGDTADPASEEIFLTIPQPYENHNGGCLQFGPRDGLLYIGMGDGGSGGDPQNFAQNPDSLLGKMLRLDVANGSKTPQIWASGLRNPWRFSFDSQTGDLYIGDVGQNTLEEIDFQPFDAPAGLNYGWKVMEGTNCFGGSNCANRTDLVRPIFTYGRSDGASVTGGYIYRGRQYPFLDGTYLFGDYGSGQIWGLRRNGTGWESQKLVNADAPIVAFGEDEAGELYLVSHQGRILRLAAEAPTAGISSVVSAASFGPGIAPGGIATAFVNAIPGLSGGVSAERYPLPVTLAGSRLEIGGKAAPLFYVGNSNGIGQVNFQVPWGTPTGDIAVRFQGSESRVRISAIAPAIFTADGRMAAVAGGGITRGGFAELYATGLGPVSNPTAPGAAASATPLSLVTAPVQVLLSGRDAEVLFAGLAPGFAGLYQVNIRVPADLAAGEAELILRTAGISSPPVRVTVR